MTQSGIRRAHAKESDEADHIILVDLSQDPETQSAPDKSWDNSRRHTPVGNKQTKSSTPSSAAQEVHPSKWHGWPSRLRRFRPWGAEMLAMLASIASFIALGTVAWVYAERPLSAWPGQSNVISISAVVSILSGIMKSSLLFSVSGAIGQAKWSWFMTPRDSSKALPGRPLNDLQALDAASRGLSGSLRGILRRPVHRHLVSVGAALTVLAAPLDYFSQQLIGVKERLVQDTDSRARIPWAAHVDHLDDGTWMAAVAEGLHRPHVEEIPVDCPGHHCTWDVVPSLGVCGKCLDLKEKLPSDWMTCSKYYCNYTLSSLGPGMLELINAPSPEFWGISEGDVKSSFVPKSMMKETLISPEYAGKPIKVDGGVGFVELGDFVVLHTRTSRTPQGTRVIHQPTATACGFWYCMKAFRTAYTGGKLRQTTLHSNNQTFRSSCQTYLGAHIDSACKPVDLVLNSQKRQRDEMFLSAEVYYQLGPNPPLPAYFDDVPGFNMQGRQFTSVSAGLGSSWNRLLTAILTGGHGSITDVLQLPEQRNFNSYLRPDPFFLAWDHVVDDLDAWVDRMCTSMTNAIRRHYKPAANDTAYDGKVFNNQAYIHVSWSWIAYPLVILITGSTFFAISVSAALERDQDLWGNNALVMALCSVDPDLKKDVQGPRMDVKTLERGIGAKKVSLGWTRDGWMFKQS